MFHDERNVLSEPRFGRPPCQRERTDRRAARTDAVAAAPAPAAGTAWPRATSQSNRSNRDSRSEKKKVEGAPLDNRDRPTAGLACHRRAEPEGEPRRG